MADEQRPEDQVPEHRHEDHPVAGRDNSGLGWVLGLLALIVLVAVLYAAGLFNGEDNDLDVDVNLPENGVETQDLTE